MGASTIAELKQQVHHTIKVLQDSFQNLAALLNPGMANQLNLLSAMYRDSRNPLTVDVIRLTEDEKEQIRQAVLLRRESIQTLETYLKAIDEDDMNGSVEGLPEPPAHGDPHGGVAKDGTLLAVPPAQPVEDVSRDRMLVFLELLPEYAMAELKAGDGILDLRHEWITVGGHTVGRHGSEVTAAQLHNRVVSRWDPLTGTTADWQKPKDHACGRHATAFTSREALVYAEAKLWISKDGEQARATAERGGGDQFKVRLPANGIFGPDFRKHLRGRTRVGSSKNPQDSGPTVFTEETTIFAVYRRDSPNHRWRLDTCYAEPEGPQK